MATRGVVQRLASPLRSYNFSYPTTSVTVLTVNTKSLQMIAPNPTIVIRGAATRWLPLSNKRSLISESSVLRMALFA